MDQPPPMFGQIAVQALAGLAIGYGVLCLYRWTRRESRPLAAIFAAGLLLRAALGLLLFWTSYLDLSFLRGLHSSDGYWIAASDAREYVARAMRAAVDGLGTVGAGSASPAYVRILALWMRIVGVSPLSGMFLNLVMYGLLCALLVWVWKPRGDWRHDLPCVVLVASLSFSPGLIVHGTQSLKDDMFAVLVTVGSVGVFLTLRPVFDQWRSVRPLWAPVLAFAVLLAVMYLAAGIRTYYAFFMLLSLGIVLASFAVRWNMDRLRRSVPLAIVILVLASIAYSAGAGPYDAYLRPLLKPAPHRSVMEGIRQWWRDIDVARVGFETSGGATNVAAVKDVTLERPVWHVRFERMAVGLAKLFVPVSLLTALSIVDFPSSRGLLIVADLDTLFIDVTALASLVLLCLRWDAARRHLPYVCFLFLLACTTTALTAYVVTNFGTMFRLRMMVIVPFWMLALSTSSGRFTPETSTAARPRAVRVSQPA